MRKIFIYFFLLELLSVLFSCSKDQEQTTEKYQYKRNNIVNVSDSIIDIATEIPVGESFLCIDDSLLILNVMETLTERGIHIFNKNTFKYIVSTGIRGKGPGEITRCGRIGINKKNRILWAIDNGKDVMWKCPIDSFLQNKDYKPTEKIRLNHDLFMDRFEFLNDSIVIGKAVHFIGVDKFTMLMAKLNIKTAVTKAFGYENVKIANTRANNSSFALSIKHNLYVNAFYDCDLLTICDLDGSLKYNIYGPNAFDHIKNRDYNYYYDVSIVDNHIIASYVNDVGEVKDKVRGWMGNLPTKFLVFDLDGNYIETIETKHKFVAFCVDEANHRIICYFEDRDNPLGYFNFNLK